MPDGSGQRQTSLPSAYIMPLDAADKPTGSKIEVMFNPAEYGLEKSNQYQSTAILGLSTPLTQFVSGNSQTLTMDLFFDSYEEKTNVSLYTKPVTELLAIDKELHAPPRVEFIWGTFSFRATIEKITQKFTMFLADGTPVRSTLNVSFKEYRTLSEQLSDPPRASADWTKTWTFAEGDSLWAIANREYGTPTEWRRIAQANDIDNPRIVEFGRDLKIPPIP